MSVDIDHLLDAASKRCVTELKGFPKVTGQCIR